MRRGMIDLCLSPQEAAINRLNAIHILEIQMENQIKKSAPDRVKADFNWLINIDPEIRRILDSSSNNHPIFDLYVSNILDSIIAHLYRATINNYFRTAGLEPPYSAPLINWAWLEIDPSKFIAVNLDGAGAKYRMIGSEHDWKRESAGDNGIVTLSNGVYILKIDTNAISEALKQADAYFLLLRAQYISEKNEDAVKAFHEIQNARNEQLQSIYRTNAIHVLKSDGDILLELIKSVIEQLKLKHIGVSTAAIAKAIGKPRTTLNDELAAAKISINKKNKTVSMKGEVRIQY